MNPNPNPNLNPNPNPTPNPNSNPNPEPAAAALGLALRGHRALQSLELWNVELDDDSGLAVVRAVHGSCPQLSKLNLGRHLIGPQTRRTLEELLDGSSVHLSLF